jgi:hypothetical protein
MTPGTRVSPTLCSAQACKTMSFARGCGSLARRAVRYPRPRNDLRIELGAPLVQYSLNPEIHKHFARHTQKGRAKRTGKFLGHATTPLSSRRQNSEHHRNECHRNQHGLQAESIRHLPQQDARDTSGHKHVRPKRRPKRNSGWGAGDSEAERTFVGQVWHRIARQRMSAPIDTALRDKSDAQAALPSRYDEAAVAGQRAMNRIAGKARTDPQGECQNASRRARHNHGNPQISNHRVLRPAGASIVLQNGPCRTAPGCGKMMDSHTRRSAEPRRT